MIQLSMLTSPTRCTALFARLLQGDVRPGTRIVGVYDAGGRAP
jgi:hypothetical protein